MSEHVSAKAAPFVDLTLGDWAAVAALVGAAVALLRFWRTVRQKRSAGILLSLDARWNDTLMLEARAELSKLMQEIDQTVKDRSPGVPSVRMNEKSEELFAECLEKLYHKDPDRYSKLTRICSFFELAGYLVRNRSIPQKDVVEMFGGAILSVGRAFSHHIENLQSRTGSTGKVWEHMIWLVGKTRKVVMKTIGT